MVTMDTDVEELLSLVISTGKEIDNAVERLQNMSEVVKKGMMQAQVLSIIKLSLLVSVPKKKCSYC